LRKLSWVGFFFFSGVGGISAIDYRKSRNAAFLLPGTPGAEIFIEFSDKPYAAKDLAIQIFSKYRAALLAMAHLSYLQ
jgi:hypothetical protein